MLRHQLGTSERPVGAEFIKTAIVGIDFIIAKSFQKGCFRIIVNLQIHNDFVYQVWTACGHPGNYFGQISIY